MTLETKRYVIGGLGGLFLISLVFVPCGYIIMTDARRALRRYLSLDRSREQPMDEAAASGTADA